MATLRGNDRGRKEEDRGITTSPMTTEKIHPGDFLDTSWILPGDFLDVFTDLASFA